MDYTYPSVFFAYLYFALMLGLALFFFVKTLRDGYWGKNGEEVKHHVFSDDESERRVQ
jgi:hypothetical protein